MDTLRGTLFLETVDGGRLILPYGSFYVHETPTKSVVVTIIRTGKKYAVAVPFDKICEIIITAAQGETQPKPMIITNINQLAEIMAQAHKGE